MPTITMLDTQQEEIAVLVKNAQGQVIAPPAPVSASCNSPAITTVVSADNTTVTCKGTPGQTASVACTVTIQAIANPSCKQTQVFTVQPDPSFPVSLALTPGTPGPQS